MAVTVSQENSSILLTAANDQITGAWHITAWRWTGTAIAAADDLLITDPVTGETLVEATAGAADYTEQHIVNAWWRNGAKLTTLDAGNVYLHYS